MSRDGLQQKQKQKQTDMSHMGHQCTCASRYEYEDDRRRKAWKRGKSGMKLKQRVAKVKVRDATDASGECMV